MSKERAPTDLFEVSQELQKFAVTEHDPTQYSIFSPSDLIELSPVKTDTGKSVRIFEDANKNQYVDISEKESAPFEMLVSRILKGIMNASDIVSVERDGNRQFLSRIMPLKNVAKETSRDETEADIDLLSIIFRDPDRSAFEEELNVQSENGKIAYFDFGQAHSDFFDEEWESVTSIGGMTRAELHILQEKLLMLRERLSGDAGYQFLLKAAESTGVDESKLFFEYESGPPETLNSFYKVLTNRIDRVLEMITEAIHTA